MPPLAMFQRRLQASHQALFRTRLRQNVIGAGAQQALSGGLLGQGGKEDDRRPEAQQHEPALQLEAVDAPAS